MFFAESRPTGEYLKKLSIAVVVLAIVRRRYLGELCRLVAALLKASFKAMAPHGQPAFVLYVQTFGDLVTCHPLPDSA